MPEIKPEIKVVEDANVQILHICYKQQILTPQDLPELVQAIAEADYDPSRLICLSGRLPVWLFLAAGHAIHATAAMGSYDPRLSGGNCVVCVSHSPEWEVGQQVELGPEAIAQLKT